MLRVVNANLPDSKPYGDFVWEVFKPGDQYAFCLCRNQADANEIKRAVELYRGLKAFKLVELQYMLTLVGIESWSDQKAKLTERAEAVKSMLEKAFS